MTVVLPFRWQGKSRIERLNALVSAKSAEWLRQWSSAEQLDVIAVEGEPDIAPRALDRWHRIDAARGTLYARTAARTSEQLGCRLSGVSMADTVGLAGGVGARALGDLLKTLAASDAPLLNMDIPPIAACRARCGTIALRWSLEGVHIELYFDAALCDALMPAEEPAKTTLVARADAVLPGEIVLHAVLDLGTAPLEDALVLQPGEIIKTKVALDSHISVRSAPGKVLFTGALVAADDRRAVRCVRNSVDQRIQL